MAGPGNDSHLPCVCLQYWGTLKMEKDRGSAIIPGTDREGRHKAIRTQLVRDQAGQALCGGHQS
jgi:hypothetical protein